MKHFEGMKKCAQTLRKFYCLKSMRELPETIDPNNIINFLEKYCSPTKYMSIDQNLTHKSMHLYLDIETLNRTADFTRLQKSNSSSNTEYSITNKNITGNNRQITAQVTLQRTNKTKMSSV